MRSARRSRAAQRNAAQQLELDTAKDRAAVLNWRLDDTRLHNNLALIKSARPAKLLPWWPNKIGYCRLA